MAINFEDAFFKNYMDTMYPMEPDTEQAPEVQLASANTGVTTDGGAFVGTRLNVPKGLNTPENMAKQSVLIADTMAGGGKGAMQGFVGLPGDLESIGRMALNYLGYNVDENTALPTSEEIGKRLESVLGPVVPQGQTTGVPTEERVRAAEGGELGGEILAPGGQLKLAGKVAKATKDIVKSIDGTEAVVKQAPKIETKAFKSWFGDSKVVNDSGKPLVVYHGTMGDFDTFQPGFKGASENETSKIGFWFTDNPQTAESFAVRESKDYVTKIDPNTGDVMKWEDGTPKKFRADNDVGSIMPVYLSMKNPLVFESKGNTDAFEAFMDFRDKWAEYINGTKGVEGAWRKKYVALNVEKTNEELKKYLKDNGYDGIILKNTEYDAPEGKTINQYMLTDPTNIKSAIGNTGEFSKKNPSTVGGLGVGGTGTAMSQEENK